MPANGRSSPLCACSATAPAGSRTSPATGSASASRRAELMLPPVAVLTDIEGTTTPISFVRETLFPFARARLPALLAERAGEPEIAAELAEVRRLAPGKPELATLLHWMDQDAKVTPLKT